VIARNKSNGVVDAAATEALRAKLRAGRAALGVCSTQARTLETLRANCEAETGLPAPVQARCGRRCRRRDAKGWLTSANEGALKGIRVVELGQLLAGAVLRPALGRHGARK